MLQSAADKAMRVVTKESDQVKVLRAQGNLEILEALICMPAEIRSYLHEVSTGKCKKIEIGGPR